MARNGFKEAEKTHISVFLLRMSLNDLNIRKSNQVDAKCKLLHINEEGKNFERSVKINYEKDIGISLGSYKFYPKDGLQQNGFIHPDGSLKFEFYVRKNNHYEHA